MNNELIIAKTNLEFKLLEQELRDIGQSQANVISQLYLMGEKSGYIRILAVLESLLLPENNQPLEVICCLLALQKTILDLMQENSINSQKVK